MQNTVEIIFTETLEPLTKKIHKLWRKMSHQIKNIFTSNNFILNGRKIRTNLNIS